MAQFSYEQYAAQLAAAQKKDQGVKVGFFKLAAGGEALVRFNIATVEDLSFATIHRVKRNPNDTFCGMSISCLNSFGKTGDCPLCEAVANGDARVEKAGKRVYVQMLVSYKDQKTGKFGEVTPVIWDKPAGFYKEIVTLINDYGSLKENLFKITRTGAGFNDTKYSINFAVPAVYKPEMVPADFSVFENFNIAKHSYWEKTVEEVQYYLANGSFPETAKADQVAAKESVSEPVEVAKPVNTLVEPVAQPALDSASVVQPTPTVTSVETPAETKFGGFSF